MLYDEKRWAPKVTEIEIEPWRKILLKAADILETKGWCRGDYVRRGHYCAVGAITKASGHPASEGEWTGDENAEMAEHMLIEHLNLTHGHIPTWNDNQASKWHVINAMRLAANR